jgi:hypothetical protein
LRYPMLYTSDVLIVENAPFTDVAKWLIPAMHNKAIMLTSKPYSTRS